LRLDYSGNSKPASAEKLHNPILTAEAPLPPGSQGGADAPIRSGNGANGPSSVSSGMRTYQVGGKFEAKAVRMPASYG